MSVDLSSVGAVTRSRSQSRVQAVEAVASEFVKACRGEQVHHLSAVEFVLRYEARRQLGDFFGPRATPPELLDLRSGTAVKQGLEVYLDHFTVVPFVGEKIELATHDGNTYIGLSWLPKAIQLALVNFAIRDLKQPAANRKLHFSKTFWEKHTEEQVRTAFGTLKTNLSR